MWCLALCLALTDVHFESAGKLPPFSQFGVDLEAPGALQRVAAEVSYRGEIILVCGDAAPTASSANGLNTVLQFYSLRLQHVLYISDSRSSCERLQGVIPSLACVWSSRINATKPKNGGLCVQLYWGYAFYFYDLRKHYIARLAVELGLNVLQTDTDVVWLANPYPALKQVFANVQLVAMQDRPMVNAGVFYAQNVERGDGAAWSLEELARRIHLFILKPEAVGHYVKWAQPPFYANVDEQTLMNDCIRSSIANVTSYAQATAGWEVKKHRTGTLKNRSFAWKATAEYKLLGYLSKAVGARGRRLSLPKAVKLDELCGQPTVDSAGTVYPLHAVGSSSPPRARLAVGGSWLFMSLPSSMSAAALRRCHADAPRRQPFVMGHLAAIRTGPWSRRALVRAYGWWQADADLLLARQMGWRRRRGALALHPPVGGGLPALASGIRSQAQLDTLAANLLLLGLVLQRRAVIPEVLCRLVSGGAARKGFGVRPVGARRRRDGAAVCAWAAPRECWRVEYLTPLEMEAEMASDAARRAAGRRLAANASGGARSYVPAGEYSPAELRGLAASIERRAARLDGSAHTPLALRPRKRLSSRTKSGKGWAGRSSGARCDELGRQVMHLLEPATSRASALTNAAGVPHNASVALLRRRLRELVCDRSALLGVLPSQASRATDSASANISNGFPTPQTASTSGKQDRQAAQLVRVLASVPLSYQAAAIQRWLSQTRYTNASAVDMQREETDLKCIEHLLKPAAIPTT
ncbi:hypothetical protein AB1Y20_013800 [Prymnesium parvum]|uniref:Nucleotide-diphospho-sugar transferase domain-containing protein n=1 Tax=Prymnesium parvum TaxID=97485 RepID=A0AB34IF65_PRYPA